MKKLHYLYLLPFAISILSCSGEQEETKPSTPLSEKALEFEIYDSLVVDYLGNLVLLDISPDNSKYLMMDQNTGEILVTDSEGSILHQYNRSGEGPEDYNSGKSGKAIFINNSEFLLPTTKAIYQYSLEGNLIRKMEPEFQGFANLVVSYSKAIIKSGDNLYFKIQGRHPDRGDLTKYTNLEKVNFSSGEYEPIIPFPTSSKFLTPEAGFQAFDYHPVFDVTADSLFIIFRNEPKLFSYSLSNLDTPAYSKIVSFLEFEERNPDKKLENGAFDIRDFLLGSINSVEKLEDGAFLIYYTSGLTDEEANEVTSEASEDFSKIFELADKYNTTGNVLFDGESVSKIIEKNELLSNIAKIASRDEIWFNLNFSEVEKDYSVIYKTRIVEK
ncbi:6-bladed beta-propeller [Algoriphagus yeomjeoni]|uniref:6-bladed beta-propeller protein n=1 Tax=Algoriphagus yeomjeoni TaxID=291403 RepID=A0A327PI28_9BACT|nr:6-bladed beta-propeller [Algoriphagus yeomjeoni]RAI91945.1 6-bladed beta-propeller protein [Algoriphagus yeomjeoni]